MKRDEQDLSRLERHLGTLLITGVLVSAIALSAGLALFFITRGAPISAHLFTLGLMLLMATPMLRVVVSVVEYVRMRDWFFVATTLVVLAELAVTVIYSLARAR